MCLQRVNIGNYSLNQAIVAFRPSADKDVAEFVGITAIVASLIFVGLQMRQMGAIARSEMYGNDLANSLAVNSAIAAHSNVWARGSRGEDFDPVDAEIFCRQVIGMADQAYYEVLEDRLLGLDESEVDLDIIDFARISA